MFKIENGRLSFYQWDINQRLIIEDASITEVHFCNKTSDCALVCQVYEENGKRLVDVPNILLQQDWVIYVFAYSGNYTRYEESFIVYSRTKPDDYFYTETEVKNLAQFENRLETLENIVTGDGIAQIVEDYLEENPIEAGATKEEREQIEQNKADIELLEKQAANYAVKSEIPNVINTALAQAKASGEFDGKDGKDGVDGKNGRDGVDGKDGYTPVKGVDYFDGAKGDKGDKGDTGAAGKDGVNGKDGYTPVKGIDYFDGKDGANGVNGKDGYTPVKGVDYFDGAPGKDGAKGDKGDPGAPGTNGKTPVKGVDYWTEVDKTEIAQEAAELIDVGLIDFATEQWVLAELANRGLLNPEFVNSTEECVDTSKIYVLPDGYIYAYKLVGDTGSGGAGYTNLADATSPDWCVNSRLGSSGVSSETNGSIVTNYIPCKKDDLIRVEGLNIGYLASNANARVHYCDSNKTLLGTAYPFTNQGAFVPYELSGYTAYKWDHKVGSTGDGSAYQSFSDNIAFVRFCGKLETDAANVIITVNEEIIAGESSTGQGYELVNTGYTYVQPDNNDSDNNSNSGSDIPSYWTSHLADKIARIKELQRLGGKDCFSFISIADLHAEQNLGQNSGLLARKVMDECNIKYALILGDIATRHSVATEADMDKSLELGFSILKPILSDALLAQGNHDGAYSTSYGQNYPRGKIYETFSRKVGMIGDVHFCDDGYGYYIDDTANRVRYVILSPHNQLGRTDVNYFNTYRYGQSQFDLMVEALTTMPKDDWGIVFASHIPPVKEVDRHGDGVIESDMTNNIPEQGLLRNMIAAFNSRSASFSGSYDAPGTWDYVNLSNVDFSNAKGNFIGYFAGHLHADCLFSGDIYNFPIITSRCDSFNENVFSNNGTDIDEALKDERVKGTTTEQSFDVFTINKAERKIYATKIGAGSNREISY